MHRHRGGTCVEDLVEALLQAEVGHIVPAVYDDAVLRREGVGYHVLHHLRAVGRFRTGLDDRCVPSADGCRQHTDGKQYREVEWANDQRHTVGHLVDLGDHAGEAYEAREVGLGSRPFFHFMDAFVDLHDNVPYVAEVSLRLGPSQVQVEGLFYFGRPLYHGRLELFELLYPPAHVKCRVGPEIGSLVFHGLMDHFFCPTHNVISPFQLLSLYSLSSG